MKNSISNSYARIINDEEQKKKDRASGRLMKKYDLEGVIGWAAAEPGETYVPTEAEYQKGNPNSAEFKAEREKEKQESADLQNKRAEKLNRLKRSKPYLFGYGAGAYG